MTASQFARSVHQPQDHQPKTQRARSAKPGTHWQRAIAAYRNRSVLTVDGFLASLGADPDTIRRYRSVVGRKVAQAYRAAVGAEPQQSGWAVAHHRIVPVFAYGRDETEILRTACAAYDKTAALVAD